MGMSSGEAASLRIKEALGAHIIADAYRDGWYFSSPKGMDDGWETVIGSIGEPSHFAKIQVPT